MARSINGPDFTWDMPKSDRGRFTPYKGFRSDDKNSCDLSKTNITVHFHRNASDHSNESSIIDLKSRVSSRASQKQHRPETFSPANSNPCASLHSLSSSACSPCNSASSGTIWSRRSRLSSSRNGGSLCTEVAAAWPELRLLRIDPTLTTGEQNRICRSLVDRLAKQRQIQREQRNDALCHLAGQLAVEVMRVTGEQQTVIARNSNSRNLNLPVARNLNSPLTPRVQRFSTLTSASTAGSRATRMCQKAFLAHRQSSVGLKPIDLAVCDPIGFAVKHGMHGNFFRTINYFKMSPKEIGQCLEQMM